MYVCMSACMQTTVNIYIHIIDIYIGHIYNMSEYTLNLCIVYIYTQRHREREVHETLSPDLAWILARLVSSLEKDGRYHRSFNGLTGRGHKVMLKLERVLLPVLGPLHSGSDFRGVAGFLQTGSRLGMNLLGCCLKHFPSRA